MNRVRWKLTGPGEGHVGRWSRVHLMANLLGPTTACEYPPPLHEAHEVQINDTIPAGAPTCQRCVRLAHRKGISD